MPVSFGGWLIIVFLSCAQARQQNPKPQAARLRAAAAADEAASLRAAAAPAAQKKRINRLPNVQVVTVDTKTPSASLPMKGVPGVQWINIGAHTKWYGYKTKTDLYVKWLREEAKRDPEGLAILADGTDVIYGGCSQEELLANYWSVVNASGGARVVWAAELGFWPEMLRDRIQLYEDFNARQQKVMRAAGVSDAAFAARAHCKDPDAECSSPISYKYLNSGFVMGPVGELLKTEACMASYNGSYYDDQEQAASCFFRHKDEVTIDYASTVVLSTWQLAGNATEAHPGRLLNSITGKRQCFAHVNGQDDCWQCGASGCAPMHVSDYGCAPHRMRGVARSLYTTLAKAEADA